MPAASPWLTLGEASGYAHRGRRFLRKAVKDGKLRAAQVGGRKELLFRAEWLDQYLEDLATPILLNVRRRAS
jgi:excisionase family DNA binding protein